MEVKLHLGTKCSVHFKQVSAVECPIYGGDIWGFDQKTASANIFVRFSQVHALEHFHLKNVLLFSQLFKDFLVIYLQHLVHSPAST